ncbi:hypothetical protein PG984_004005 [Apiospora sp. TS-2023a]
MFKWYQQAEICYAHLNDVTKDSTGYFAKKDRIFWFKRGWKLQYLVAPSEVVFFDSNWQDLGTKHSLVSLIHQIARVEVCHFQAASGEDVVISPGSRLNGCSETSHLAKPIPRVDFSDPWRRATTAQKMKWAAGRHTSRLEDRAYSLLGVFDVTMPLLYGEGQTAFIRLQEETIKRHPYDHSIFCWRDESKLGHTGLFAPNPDYFGLSRDVRSAPVTFREEMARDFGDPAGTPHDPIEAVDAYRVPASSNDAAYWELPMNRLDKKHDLRLPQFNSPQSWDLDYRSDGIYEGLTTRDLESHDGGVVVVRRRKKRGWPGDPEDVNVTIEGVDIRPQSLADEGPQEESPVSDEDGPNEDDAYLSGASTPKTPGSAFLVQKPPGFDTASLWEGFMGFGLPHPFTEDDGVPENCYYLETREMIRHMPKRLIQQYEQQQKEAARRQLD